MKLMELKQWRGELTTQVESAQRTIGALDVLIGEMGGKVEPVTRARVVKPEAVPAKGSMTRNGTPRKAKKCGKCGKSHGWCQRGGCVGGAMVPPKGGTPTIVGASESGVRSSIAAGGDARAPGELSTSDKVRRACASCGEPFQAVDVRGACERLFAMEQKQLIQVGALLSQFADRGELKREGSGSSASYRVVALKG